MARANDYPTTRGPGAGRPKGSTSKIPDPETPPPDFAVYVEGRVRINGDDDLGIERIGKLRGIAETLGLVAHAAEIGRDDLTTVRRNWGVERVSLATAKKWIEDYPGITFLEWTEKVFLGDLPMNDVTFFAARAKARVCLSNLWRAGTVRKDKNAYGQMTLWPNSAKIPKPDAIPADLLVNIEEMIKTAISVAHRKGQTVSTRAVALEIANFTWKKRLFYEK